jgi:hypothetical protein
MVEVLTDSGPCSAAAAANYPYVGIAGKAQSKAVAKAAEMAR